VIPLSSPARSLLTSLLLHGLGVAAAMAYRMPTVAHAEWQGEEPSVRWVVAFAPAVPAAVTEREPAPAEIPPADVVVSEPLPPEATSAVPIEQAPQRSEPAAMAPAPDVVGTAGASSEPPPEPPAEPPAAAPEPPPPPAAREASPVEPEPPPSAKPPDDAAPTPARPAAVASSDSMKVVPSPMPGCNAPPRYPFVAWRRHIEGTVVVSLRIDATGTVVEARVARSSGNSMLDDAAVAALKAWRFTPARDQFGPHECTHEQEVVFRIRA